MYAIKQLIPHLFTAGNLVGGILAILITLSGHVALAPLFIFASALFDFLDGFMARLLKVPSEFGKQLDSLADMVTFGVAPGIILFVLMDIPNGIVNDSFLQGTQNELISHYFWPSCGNPALFFNDINLIQDGYLYNGQPYKHNQIYHSIFQNTKLPFIALILPVFAMFRLAKFNLDTRQSDGFIGLPTPAMTIFVASIPMILFFSDSASSTETSYRLLLLHPYSLVATTIILSILMVVPLPLFALKFKSFGWKGNEIRYIFLTLSAILLATLFWWGLPIIIVLYILLSIIHNLIARKGAKAQRLQ